MTDKNLLAKEKQRYVKREELINGYFSDSLWRSRWCGLPLLSGEYRLPWGTFIINISGSFAMGVLMTIIVERELLPAAWRLFLCVGLLGGFTTFSSFGYEALMLLMEGRLAAALGYAGGSVVLGVLAAGLGVLCARSF